MLSAPDVLVLGGGGVLGEAWLMGVLAGIEDGADVDLRRCEHFVGTSAGSIVAAHLAAGQTPRRPDATELAPEAEPRATAPETAIAAAARRAGRRASRWGAGAAAPLMPLAMTAVSPAGAIIRAALLRRIPRPAARLDDLRRSVDGSGARFDGRLRVVAVERRSGRRVVFGSPLAPAASVGEAVAASCTVPWLFEPVEIGGREYVDGGVWSPTNLDVAPGARDTHVLCLNPTSGIQGDHTLVGVARSFSRSAATAESLVLRRRGAIVRIFGPDDATIGVLGHDFMDPGPRKLVIEAGYRQGLRIAKG